MTDKNKTRVMTRDQVRAFDRWAINELGAPGVVLMENAGRSCAELIKEKLAAVKNPRVCVFCGTGNNGGDGYVIARHLLNAGYEVRVLICGDPARVKHDAKTNLDVLKGLGQVIDNLDPHDDDTDEKVNTFAAGANMLVDALFGTGLRGRLSDEYVRLIECINNCDCPVLAVDIPSGLDCDTAEVLGAAIRADYTVTFVALKTGFVSTEDAKRYTGQVVVASIGVEPVG